MHSLIYRSLILVFSFTFYLGACGQSPSPSRGNVDKDSTTQGGTSEINCFLPESSWWFCGVSSPNIILIPEDTDGDGLEDQVEIALGTDYELADSDGDGCLDGCEVFGNTAGCIYAYQGWYSGQGTPDPSGWYTDPRAATGYDTDGGGTRDCLEAEVGTDPRPGHAGDDPVPPATTGLTGTVGDQFINLSWNAYATADQYEVAWEIQGEVQTHVVSTTTFTIAPVVNGTSYSIKVRTHDPMGWGPYSTPIELIPNALPDPPSAPSGLAVQPEGSSEIHLAWQDNSTNETQFVIERRDFRATEPWLVVATVPADSESYLDSGLAPFTRYDYRVRAINEDGSSDYTDQLTTSTAYPTPTSPPYAPSNIGAIPQSWCQVKVTWSDNADDEENYYVEYRLDDNPTWSPISTRIVYIHEIPMVITIPSARNTSTVSFCKRNVAYPGARFDFRVKATNEAGSSAWVELPGTVQTYTSTATPSAPSNIAGQTFSSQHLRFSWHDNATNENAFRFQWKRSSDDWDQSGEGIIMGPNIEKSLIDGLLPNTAYDFRIQSCFDSSTTNCSSFVSYYNRQTYGAPGMVPPSPQGLNVISDGRTRTSLNWSSDGSGLVHTYVLERTRSYNGQFEPVVELDPDQTSYIDTGASLTPATYLLPGVRYWYRLKATNTVGESSYSSEIPVQMPSP